MRQFSGWRIDATARIHVGDQPETPFSHVVFRTLSGNPLGRLRHRAGAMLPCEQTAGRRMPQDTGDEVVYTQELSR